MSGKESKSGKAREALTRVRGTYDLLPEETHLWQYLESAARRVFSNYGYAEIRAPLFERTELFARAVGSTSDIVEKEMYTFSDRGGDLLSLRPEGTASVVRVFIEKSMHRHLPWPVYYMGPMFRYERPQKGRQRQFHQIGCELFGPEGPLADAELMAMVMRFFREIGLEKNLTLEINSLGCADCRPPYQKKLIDYLTDRRDDLCADCQRRLQRNPLRILDCKKTACGEIARAAPHMKDHLCPACADHFSGLRSHLEMLDEPFVVNPMMVRGLDYYNRSAFEVATRDLGAQNAVAAGGRYDTLVTEMGGRQATPAIGFAMGMERLVLLLGDRADETPRPDVYVMAAAGAAGRGLKLAEWLRDGGLRVVRDLRGGSIKSQTKRADRSGAALIMTIDEGPEGRVTLRRRGTWDQESVEEKTMVETVRRLLDGEYGS